MIRVKSTTMAFAIAALCYGCPHLFAASHVSPNLSGTWAGTARGSDYHENDNSGTSGTPQPTVTPASGNFTATFTHVGDDLTINAQAQTDGGAVSFTLTGKAGDFALWATGTQMSDSHVDQIFMSGRFAPKGDKLIGKMLFFHSGNITFVSYSFKKTASAATAPRAVFTADTSNAGARESTDPPFNVGGKVSGKVYTFGTNGKGGSYKADVSGTIAPALGTATLNFADGVGLTFHTSEVDADKYLVFSGTSGSENLMMFGKSSSSAASGTGWIFGATRLVEFKFNIKKQ